MGAECVPQQEQPRDYKTAAFLAASLTVALCAGGAGVYRTFEFKGKQATPTEVIAPSSTPPAERAEPAIDLASAPDELPQPVRDAANHVVRISSVIDGFEYAGSGVRINGQIITASHVVKNPDKKNQRIADCGQLYVSSSNKTDGDTTKVQDARAFSLTYKDLGLIKLSKQDKAELGVEDKGLDVRDVRRDPPKVGEKFWAIGWSSQGGKYRRNPDEQQLNHTKGETAEAGYTEPHITIGFVVKTKVPTLEGEPGDQLAVVQGVRSYSKLPDPTKAVSGGNSGGALVDAEGDVVGILGSTTNGLERGNVTRVAESLDLLDVDYRNKPTDFRPNFTLASYLRPDDMAAIQQLPSLPCKSS